VYRQCAHFHRRKPLKTCTQTHGQCTCRRPRLRTLERLHCGTLTRPHAHSCTRMACMAVLAWTLSAIARHNAVHSSDTCARASTQAPQLGPHGHTRPCPPGRTCAHLLAVVQLTSRTHCVCANTHMEQFSLQQAACTGERCRTCGTFQAMCPTNVQRTEQPMFSVQIYKIRRQLRAHGRIATLSDTGALCSSTQT
jgi:hypothetical protein